MACDPQQLPMMEDKTLQDNVALLSLAFPAPSRRFDGTAKVTD
jgi:hypothetical protein